MNGRAAARRRLSHKAEQLATSQTEHRPKDQRTCTTGTSQRSLPYDQNRLGTRSASSRGSDAPTDENLVDDDIIEENSHVIPPHPQKSEGAHQPRSQTPLQQNT